MAKGLPLLLVTCAQIVLGQYIDSPVGYVSSTNNRLCNESFADADGTGIYYYDLNLPQGQGASSFNQVDATTLHISVASTLIQGENSNDPTQLSFWFSSDGANYTDDLDLGFDACGFVAAPFPEEVNARGATDDGSCNTMLDEACVNAIKTSAQNHALELTLSPSVVNGLNASSLPNVCAQLSQKLNSDLPQACARYFEGLSGTPTTFVAALPLTGSTKAYNESCSINGTYFHVGALTAVNNSVPVYDQLAYTPAPILVVYMPVANAARTHFITQSNSWMVCDHITHFKEGSRVPPLPLVPEQNPGLSRGAIAGAVIGALVGAIVTAWLGWMFLKKRQHAKEDKPKQGGAMVEVDGLNSQIVQASDGRLSKVELSGSQYHMQELDAQGDRTHELEGQDYQTYELDERHHHHQTYDLPGSQTQRGGR